MFKKVCFLLILISFFSVFGCRISGTITENGAGIGGVTVSLSGDAAMIVTTNSEGKYTFSSVMPGSYTITPDKPDYTFDPESAAVTKTQLLTDVGGINFERVTRRIVFLTYGPYKGTEIGGLSGADDICRVDAELALLPGTYKAWLSDSAESPATRFNLEGGPFILPDGTTIVADNWEDLTDGTIQHEIDMHANKEWSIFNRPTWTSTNVDGTVYNKNITCNDWSDTSEYSGRNGQAGCSINGCGGEGGVRDSRWTDTAGCGCDNEFYLYCFQQDYK